MSGGICTLTLFDGQARALIAHTTHAAETARGIHNCSPTASAALGRTLTGTALLAAMLKTDGDSVTLTVKGDGPLGTIVCTGDTKGSVKGYAINPLADPPRKADGKLDVGTAVGKNGHIAVIKDMGMGEPFIGYCPLVSGEIAQDIASYLLTSEQTPSLVSLGVLCLNGHVIGAGGALIQPMPGCSEEVISLLEQHASKLNGISVVATQTISPSELAKTLLEGLPYRLLGESPVEYKCYCNRQRIESVLLSLGESELNDMINTDGKAQVSCQFCANIYDFTKEELQNLVAEGKAAAELRHS